MAAALVLEAALTVADRQSRQCRTRLSPAQASRLVHCIKTSLHPLEKYVYCARILKTRPLLSRFTPGVSNAY